MSDGVLDRAPQVRILVNLVNINLHAVRAYVGRSSQEVRVVKRQTTPVCLVLGCPTEMVANAQAELFWSRGIPARICTDWMEEEAFIAALLDGKSGEA